MKTDSNITQNGTILPLLVPRVICIGLDLFGWQVLRSFREDHLPNVEPASTRLTVAFQYDTAGFTPFSLDISRDRGDDSQSISVGMLSEHSVPQDEFVQQLHRSRQLITAQSVRSDLIQRGYRIGQIPEVYLFIQASEPEHIRALRAIAITTRAYLRQYDPVRITAFVCLADIENPLTSLNIREQTIEAMNQLLLTQLESENQIGGEPILDRGYVVSQETIGSPISGQGSIPDNELAYRTAGFLATHYLNGLRQPMTPYEHRLFGANQNISTSNEQAGLCHLFGYADLRFEVNHILEWCAIQHASVILNQELLRTEVTHTADEQASANQSHHLQQSLRAAALPIEAEAQVNYILQQITVGLDIQGQLPNTSGVELLDYWRTRRRTYEHLARDAERRIEGFTKNLIGRYQHVLANLLDEQITSHTYGLAQAEKQLDAMVQWCRKGQAELDTALASQPVPDRPAFTSANNSTQILQQTWLRLFRITDAIPNNTTLATYCSFAALLTLMLAFISDMIGLGIVALIVICAASWIGYVRWWLPKQLEQAQQAYQQQLKTWHSSHLADIARQQLITLYKALLTDIQPPSMYAPDGGKLQQQVATWRRQLQRAAEQCATRVNAMTKTPSLLRSGDADRWFGENLTITQGDFQAYYRQLTHWEPKEVADTFLQMVRAKHGGWQEFSIEQIVEQLTKVCQQRYVQQSHTQLTGLDLEYHLLDVVGKGEKAISNLLAALVENAAPMARLQRLHGYWERPTLRLLIVHNPEQSIFREPAEQLNLHVVSGAHERQVICICTEHLVPTYDLAMSYDWRQVFGPMERQSHA